MQGFVDSAFLKHWALIREIIQKLSHEINYTLKTTGS